MVGPGPTGRLSFTSVGGRIAVGSVSCSPCRRPIGGGELAPCVNRRRNPFDMGSFVFLVVSSVLRTPYRCSCCTASFSIAGGGVLSFTQSGRTRPIASVCDPLFAQNDRLAIDRSPPRSCSKGDYFLYSLRGCDDIFNVVARRGTTAFSNTAKELVHSPYQYPHIDGLHGYLPRAHY